MNVGAVKTTANAIGTKFIKGMVNNKFADVSLKYAVKKDSIFKYKNMDKTLPALAGLWMGGFYVHKTLKMDIPKERKQTLAMNNVITTLAGVCCGTAIINRLNANKDDLANKVIKIFKSEELKVQKDLRKGAKAIIPILGFTLALRYIAPVFATPLAGKATQKLQKIGWIKTPEAEPKANSAHKLNTLK